MEADVKGGGEMGNMNNRNNNKINWNNNKTMVDNYWIIFRRD